VVKHVLRDGKQMNTVKDVLISRQDFPLIYNVIKEIEEGQNDRVLRSSKESS
jgi:hypothetical protein